MDFTRFYQSIWVPSRFRIFRKRQQISTVAKLCILTNDKRIKGILTLRNEFHENSRFFGHRGSKGYKYYNLYIPVFFKATPMLYIEHIWIIFIHRICGEFFMLNQSFSVIMTNFRTPLFSNFLCIFNVSLIILSLWLFILQLFFVIFNVYFSINQFLNFWTFYHLTCSSPRWAVRSHSLVCIEISF